MADVSRKALIQKGWSYIAEPLLGFAAALVVAMFVSGEFHAEHTLLLSFGLFLVTLNRVRQSESLDQPFVFPIGILGIVVSIAVWSRVALDGKSPHLLTSLPVLLVALAYFYWVSHQIDAASDPSSDQSGVAKSFHVCEAASFYDRAAESYDRHVDVLAPLHNQVASALDEVLCGRSQAKVLDLGSGTGLLCRRYGYHAKDRLSWLACDISPEMSKRFRAALPPTATECVDIRTCDVHDFLAVNEGDRFDVIILSLLLSSMDRLPDFRRLRELLKKDGLLIVGDIECNGQDISTARLQIPDNTEMLSLSLTPRSGLEIAVAAMKEGFQLKQPLVWHAANETSQLFILTFAGGTA